MKLLLITFSLFLLASCTESTLVMRTDKLATVTPGCDMYVTYQFCDHTGDICPTVNFRPVYSTVCENKVTTVASHTENCGKNYTKTVEDKTETITK